MLKSAVFLLLGSACFAAPITYVLQPADSVSQGVHYVFSGASGTVDSGAILTPISLGTIILSVDQAIPHTQFAFGVPITTTINGSGNQFGLTATFTYVGNQWNFAGVFNPRPPTGVTVLAATFSGRADGTTASPITAFITPEPAAFCLSGIGLLAMATRRLAGRARLRNRQIVRSA